jgi:hypothetical protein
MSTVATFACIGLIYNEFEDLPQKNIWQSHECEFVHTNPFQEPYICVNVINTTLTNVCAYSDKFLEIHSYPNVTEPSFECYVPRNPIEFDECYDKTPIQNLILLSDTNLIIIEELEKHEIYYWLTWTFGAISIVSFIFFCYSYWFRWCRCNENTYWCCCKADSINSEVFEGDFSSLLSSEEIP